MRTRSPGLVATALLGATPGLAMLRLYAGSRAAAVLVGAAVVSTALVALTSTLGRRRALAALLLQAAAFVGYAYATTGSGVVDGLVHGWARLLSTVPPVDTSAAMLVPALALTWAASAGGGELWMRPGPLLRPITPAALALVVAVVFAGGYEVPAVALGCAFLLGAGALLVGGERSGAEGRGATTIVSGPGGAHRVSRRHRSRPAPVTATTVALGVVALVVASVAGPALQFGRNRQPFDPRAHLATPVEPLSAVSPLDLIAGNLHDPNVPLFKVRSADPEDWQIAVLDNFDGYDWSSPGRFQATGSQLPAESQQAGVPSARVTQTVTVEGLTGPWLPAAAAPVEVSGVGFDADLGSGTLVASDGKAAGETYRVTSEVAEPNLSALASAQTATTAQATADLDLPAGMPAVLQTVAATATSGASTPLGRALLLERYLRLDYRLDDKAPAGHSYGHLVQFLTKTKAGTSEQFATAFAVLGRAVGLPTRVVVGFSPGAKVAPGTWQVDSGDALAWPQVDFAGAGWITFDPTPTKKDGKGASLPVGGPGTKAQKSFSVTPPVAKPQAPTSPVTPAHATPAAPVPGGQGGAGAAAAGGHGAGVPWWAFAIAATFALLLVFEAGVVVAKRRRVVRRRRAGSPRRRIEGAWAEVLDRLAEAGHPDPSTLTVAEVVGGRTALAGMYRPVNQALFSDSEPSEDAAVRAWRSYDRYRTELSGRRSRLRRLGFALDPRPLLRSARRKDLSWG